MPAALFSSVPAALFYTAVVGLVAFLAVEEVRSAEEEEEQIHRRRKKTRKYGVHPINRKRGTRGFYNTTYREVRKDGAKFFNYTRMSLQQFDNLLVLLKERLTKRSYRPSLPAELRLLVTLRFLATGDSLRSLSLSYRIGISTCHGIIGETCKVLWSELQPIYLREPTREEFVEIARQYGEKWNMPHCAGCIDGKHIIIICPKHTGSLHFCYKKSFSINLMGCCDSNLCFIYVDVGAQGSISDGGVFRHSNWGSNIIDETVDLPEDSVLPGDPTGNKTPFFFVGDEAFPLRVNLMRPYPRRNLGGLQQKVFNYRLSRARFTIENAFGLLAARWRIFHRVIEARNAETVENYVKAAVVLHNYIIKTNLINCNVSNSERVIMSEVEANPVQFHQFRDMPEQREARNSTRAAFAVREQLTEYFFSPAGSIPFQVQKAQAT